MYKTLIYVEGTQKWLKFKAFRVILKKGINSNKPRKIKIYITKI